MTAANVNPSGMPQPLGRAIAWCINAPVFAQQIVQETEFFAQQGNHPAVAATLAHARAYLDEDTTVQTLEEFQDSPNPSLGVRLVLRIPGPSECARGPGENGPNPRTPPREPAPGGNPGPVEEPVRLFYAACS